jgi:hypothetical protein
MKLFFPDNIFSKLYADKLPDEVKNEISFIPSSAIPAQLKTDPDSAGLITPTDILNSADIFISSKTGISFEGILSNSYMYFLPEQKDIKEISLHGDVSTLEIILSKIFFKENFNTDIQVEILTDLNRSAGKNLLLIGDTNFSTQRFEKGISFAEQMTELLSLPYVNFILASMNKDSVETLNNASAGISQKIYEAVESDKTGTLIPEHAKEFLKENLSYLIYEFDEQDIDDVHQIIRLPYFHGLINDIIEPKFI